MNRLMLILVLLVGVTSTGVAQKYGHLNYGNLISALPDTKEADTEIESYQKQLVAKGEEMANKFKERYVEFLKKVQEGTVAPKIQQETQKSLEDEQAKINAYEQEVQQKLEQKRQELLKPILEKVNGAIEAVAKENGYSMIFDTSVFNSILFTREADDLMDEVKAKLGI